MLLPSNRGRRPVVVGAVVVAAATVPAIAALTSEAGAPDRPVAACLAWLGSKNDGTCISWSNSSGAGGASGGSPQIGVGGQGSNRAGVSTGPLFPGNTINVPLG